MLHTHHIRIKKARDDEKATVRAESELKRLDSQLRVRNVRTVLPCILVPAQADGGAP